MFLYSKVQPYPVKINNKNPKLAKYILSQYGGPYGELGAALRYLNQRFTMPDERGKCLLADIGTEELGHVEMICLIIYQLTKDCSIKELEDAGLGCSYALHGKEIFMTDCNGQDFTVSGIGATGDYLADLSEDMAAEEKARATYEHLIDLSNDEDVKQVLLYLRQREIVHFNRFKNLRDTYKKEYKK